MSLIIMPFFSVLAELHLLVYVITTTVCIATPQHKPEQCSDVFFLPFYFFLNYYYFYLLYYCSYGTMPIAADVASAQLHRAVTFLSVYSCGCLSGHFAS